MRCLLRLREREAQVGLGLQEVADLADARAVPGGCVLVSGGCVLREELALVCLQERATARERAQRRDAVAHGNVVHVECAVGAR